MKRFLISLVAFLGFFHAGASVVKNLDVKVRVNADGSASVIEYWDIELGDEAETEWYVCHYNLGSRSIANLSVTGYVPDSKVPVKFETLDEWDVDEDREYKTGKCGINDADDGPEICFGFGDWGRHQYTVSYTYDNFVQQYDSCQGFHCRFVEMNPEIENCRVAIYGGPGIKFSKDNVRKWAFGYEGTIIWKGDSIVATPSGSLSKGNFISVLVEIDNNTFAGIAKSDDEWANVKEKAMEDSSYLEESDGILDWICYIVVLAIPALFVLRILWYIVSLEPLRKKFKRERMGIKKGNYYRDIDPKWTFVDNDQVLAKMGYGLGLITHRKRMIAALLLRLVNEGKLGFVTEKKKSKGSKCIKILSPLYEKPKGSGKADSVLANRILHYLTLASGDDLILQPSEFSKWAKKNSDEMEKFDEMFDADTSDKYIAKHAAHLYGLKFFLEDFTLVAERKVEDVKLWNEYLIYAAFFGISEQVMDDMKKVCPEFLNLSEFAKAVDDVDISYISTWSTSFHSEVSDSYSSSGGGGGSFGGGGGGGR